MNSMGKTAVHYCKERWQQALAVLASPSTQELHLEQTFPVHRCTVSLSTAVGCQRQGSPSTHQGETLRESWGGARSPAAPRPARAPRSRWSWSPRRPSCVGTAPSGRWSTWLPPQRLSGSHQWWSLWCCWAVVQVPLLCLKGKRKVRSCKFRPKSVFLASFYFPPLLQTDNFQINIWEEQTGPRTGLFKDSECP